MEERGGRPAARQQRPCLAILLALLLAAPVAHAGWRAYGTFEPDSMYDDVAYLWFDEPDGHPPRVYFQAFVTHSQVANPNVGALGSQMEPVGEVWWSALLGVWTDCNDDGYVGLLETAHEEYRNELLFDKTRCPVGTAHNADGWVTELLWIGRGGEYARARDPRVLVDDEAMMWGDLGKPFPEGEFAAGGSCAFMALPKGTLQRTGALLDYADCFDGHLVGGTWNHLVSTLDPDDSQGLALEDERRWDEPGHPLNVDTFGDDGAENGFVTLTDCEGPTLLESTAGPLVVPLVPEAGGARDFVANATRTGPRPPPPAGPGVNPEGNVPGTVNRTREELNMREPTDPRAGNCDSTDDPGHDFYALETENVGVQPTGKTEADMNFNFSAQRRGVFQEGGIVGAPAYGGLWWGVHYDPFAAPTRWMATGGSGKLPATVRDDEPAPANATHWTFYAFLGPEGRARGATPGGVAEYGARFCPAGYGETAGVHYGWECDADRWYRNADGTRKTERFPLARPGQPYQLRDVDCFDGTLVRGVPAGAGTGALSAEPCRLPAEP